jgi:hypothetical protein
METALIAEFGDGEYRFYLPLPQVFELERSGGDTSILVMEDRLRAAIGQDADGNAHFLGGGSAMVKDVLETIRLGLIGGNSGMVDGQEVEVGPLRAKQLVNLYAYPARPFEESAVLAWRILSAAIFGIRLKKKEAAPA